MSLSPSPSVSFSYGPSMNMNTNNNGLDIFTKVFMLLIFFTLFVRVCYVYMNTRREQHGNDNINNSIASMIHHNDQNDNLTGIPYDVIKSYHTFPYSKTDSVVGTTCDHDTTCAICIEDYEESEMLRMLPQCRHYFHRDCVDAWLKLNATCPVCRNSLMETRTNNNIDDNNVINHGGNALERV
ncbi:RING-H2 finger protein ATL70-like [Vigna unguiculata]|uniref:E3 ubiquitin-protein ligase n=1 Tax=Vigna unguiculata TaxID=3917 RepID=A0A4D6NGA5_VIGUN|nr:RING-H2 finger protein ATL70-like [Vigna unguiculata]QCE12388.1 E3 ubiquitin-protein ligase [Vigna unguiculata]